MDFLPILVLLLFVVLGGIIAIVADNVGRKLGKKRLKLGNLRPKHTAMLGTFIVGSLISLFTIILITVASSDVRRWITEGNRAVRQLVETRKSLEKVEADLKAQQVVYEKLNKDYRAKEDQVQKLNTRLTRLQSERAKLEPQIARLTSAVATADARVRNITAQRQRAQNELRSKQALLATAQGELKKVELERMRQERLAKAASADKKVTDDYNQKLTVENEKLEKSTIALKADIKRLELDTKNLETARDNAKLELDDAQKRLDDYQIQLVDAARELRETQGLLQQASIEASVYRQFTSQTRREPITYQTGEEVTRVALAGGLSIMQAEEAMSTLLRDARRAAIERGARKTEGYMEAGFIERTDQRTGEVITPEMIERQIVQKIATSKEPVVVVAFSSLNAFRGEPISLEVDVLPNPVVYDKGEMIAEVRVDGDKDESTILSQLEDLFTNRIRERAKQDKMIPRMGTDQFGEVAPAEIFKLMSQVKAARRAVRVQALATAETRAGDPLKLDFRIR